MYRSPKYWKEMARARKEHEAQMKREAERQASSSKQQAQFRMILRIILKDII